MKKFFLFLILSIMSLNIYSQSSAIVLSGGGAKGAYQVGVWKAMDEFDLTDDVSVFSGTSVGSLNSALFACASSQKAESIWRSKVNPETFFPSKKSQEEAVQANKVTYISQKDEGDVTSLESLEESFEHFFQVLGDVIVDIAEDAVDYVTTSDASEGMYNRDSLREIIDSVISINKLNKSGKTVYAASLRKNQLGYKLISSLFEIDYTHYFKLNEQISDSIAADILLASSAMPGVYPTQTLPADTVENGRRVGVQYEYLDGGVQYAGGRNTPIIPVLKHPEIKTVYIVYLMSKDEIDYSFTSEEKKLMEKSGKTFIEIYPSQSLGNFINGTLNFQPEKVADLIDLGYKDASEILSRAGYFKVPPAFRKRKIKN